jgi:hypothetical protein
MSSFLFSGPGGGNRASALHGPVCHNINLKQFKNTQKYIHRLSGKSNRN